MSRHGPARRRPSRRTRLGLTAVAALAGLGTTGIALAYWTSAGTGTGSATTGRTSAVTLTPGTPDAMLYPGGAADVTLSVSSSNATPVTIASLVLDSGQGADGFDVDAAHTACGTSTLTFIAQTNGAAGWSVPARIGNVNGALAIRLPNALAMSPDAGNPCQGAVFVVYLRAVS